MESLVSDWIVTLFQWVGVLFNFVFGLFLILSGFLVNVATTFNFNILSDSNAILKTGWLAARDIANLGFVILAIGSALATVLRYPPEYDVRKLLPKFIAAAILVNFSMTLAAIPIQFSNVLTGFFLSRVTSVSDPGIGKTDLAGPLVNILGPQKLLTGDSDPLPPDPGDSAGGAISAVIFASLATLMFNIIFTLLMAILLLAFAVMLISRYFMLTFLIIFSPLICLVYVFPALKQYLGTWTNAYTKWVFMGPAMMFFVYMAITVAEKLPGTALKEAGGNVIMAGLGGVLEQFINLSFVTAILVMGLLAASKAGTTSGTMAWGAANGIGNGAKKFFKNQATKFTEGGAQTSWGQKIQKRFKATSESLDIKEGDGFGTKLWKKGVATTGFGQAIAVVGGNKKGLYGTLTNETFVGAKIKSEKEKKPESKKDVEKKLGELQTTRANMAKKGLKTKDVDEEIKINERKLYKFRREELEADYAQQDITKTNEAIQKIGYGEKNGKPKDENSIEDPSFSLNIGGLTEKEITNNKELQEKIKKLTKGLEDPNEKGKITETASKKKIDAELEAIKNRINKLKEIKEKEKRELNTDEQDALNMLQSVEYQLNAVVKKKEEEIQILGGLRKRRAGAKEQFELAMKGATEGEKSEEGEEEYKSGTNEDGEEKIV